MLSELRLPEDVVLYRKTGTFTQASAPKGFLSEHSTKAGVWGSLVVAQGTVEYFDEESSECRTLASGEHQIINPQSVHRIAPADDAAFYVAFYKKQDDTADGIHQNRSFVE